MLQQTRVETAIPYYDRWMERFPTVEALAGVDEETVLKAWEGLGYYSRARNLHRSALIVRERLGGVLPQDSQGLKTLPGIGEYSAGAIASIAYGEVVPAVDGNVRRVLSRLFDLEDPTAATLRERAGELVDPDRPGDWNQALMEAREKALENRRAVHWGHDPRDAGVATFEAAVDKVIAIHSPTWKNPSRMAGQWRQTLRDYAHPRIGRKRVSEVATADVLAILKPIWSSKPATARAVHQRIGAVMNWAVAKGYRPDNPAGDTITAALPRNGNAIRHHKALPHGEVAAALAEVRDSESHAGVRLALEFMVLTATRSNEVRGAACDEVEHDVWTIPADRMKAKREHRVPLSGRALEILEEARKLHGGGGIVFCGAKGGRIHASMFSKSLRRLGIAGTPHGMRSSFRDWCSETGVAREVAEAALAHKVRSQTEAAYARSDLLDRRREVMQAWAAYLAGKRRDPEAEPIR